MSLILRLPFGNKFPNVSHTKLPEDINTANVYDPRLSGYGSSNRSYVDDVLGQPRFAYDDVNAIRMPNYIVRSHVDMLPFSIAYGGLSL